MTAECDDDAWTLRIILCLPPRRVQANEVPDVCSNERIAIRREESIGRTALASEKRTSDEEPQDAVIVSERPSIGELSRVGSNRNAECGHFCGWLVVRPSGRANFEG